ncbi:MAG: NADH-quinone oxidoreductase subunit B family protein [Alphaproteobacteria bacterium]|uniref:NADH-quinone oxidoreductase subunit B family protein n=1 Tax=Candidatus Nitrobium versatile TaxID=2884831 RepID=A0A953M1U2_9BACT|nr:NADH-quinone oxidoreductase subunit B family protein [Candidatus Nitrobium versatile]
MIRILYQIFRTGVVSEDIPRNAGTRIEEIGERLEEAITRHFRKSLTIRQVDAGSCNGCELEIHALNNPFYNCERYGIHFTASPRFADLLLVTGPVTRNMEIALRRTYNATPPPKLVVAVGDCGCNGGIFGKSYASLGGVDQVIPVSVAIHGCPPAPAEILQGIMRAVEGKGKGTGTEGCD